MFSNSRKGSSFQRSTRLMDESGLFGSAKLKKKQKKPITQAIARRVCQPAEADGPELDCTRFGCEGDEGRLSLVTAGNSFLKEDEWSKSLTHLRRAACVSLPVRVEHRLHNHNFFRCTTLGDTSMKICCLSASAFSQRGTMNQQESASHVIGNTGGQAARGTLTQSKKHITVHSAVLGSKPATAQPNQHGDER